MSLASSKPIKGNGKMRTIHHWQTKIGYISENACLWRFTVFHVLIFYNVFFFKWVTFSLRIINKNVMNKKHDKILFPIFLLC